MWVKIIVRNEKEIIETDTLFTQKKGLIYKLIQQTSINTITSCKLDEDSKPTYADADVILISTTQNNKTRVLHFEVIYPLS